MTPASNPELVREDRGRLPGLPSGQRSSRAGSNAPEKHAGRSRRIALFEHVPAARHGQLELIAGVFDGLWREDLFRRLRGAGLPL